MELRLARYLLPLLLVLPIKGTDFSSNGTLPVSEGAREPKANRRVVRLYSGVRPKPIACAGEGFQADPDDCSIFHRCMKGGNGKYLSFRFQCGPGTIYDPETEICNHPQRTKRTECGGNGPIKGPNIEFTLENDISREIPSPMSTRDPLSIQKISKTKDFTAKNPWTSHQNLQSTPSSSIPFVTTVIRQDTKTNKVPTKRQVSESSTNSITQSWMSSQISSTTPPRMTQPGDICAYEGFVGDSEDCHKFYRCINNHRGGFIRYEFLCNEPTIWDDEKQACNHAWAVKRRRCGRVSPLVGIDSLSKKDQKELSETTGKTSDSKQSQLQINSGSKVTQIQTQIINGSVIQNQTQINYKPLANNENVEPHFIQNQTQTSHGNAVSQTQTQLNYGDKAVQIQLQKNHSKESSQTQTQISQYTSTPKNTQNHETQATTSSNSNNKCTEGGFVGDSDDCKKFYRCVDNGKGGFTRYEFFCGEGTVWDSNIEACNHAWAVKDCGGKASSHATSQSIHTTTIQGSTKPITSSSTFSSSTTTPTYSSSTELTIEEDNDIPYGNQPISSESSKPAESEPTATKSPQNTSDNNCNTSGFMGDSNDCKKFYRCVDNGKDGYTRYEFSCGEGTVWDQKIEACNHAWAVPSCGGDPATLTTASTVQNIDAQTSSQKPLHNDDYDTGYGSQNNEPQFPSTTVATTTIKSSSTTTHQVPGSGNECTSSGFMGDGNDCKKFYRCVDNGNGGYTKYEFSCGEETVWDSKLQACNHARDVDKCGENSAEDINKVETTTQKESGSTITSTTHIFQPDEDNDVGYGQHSSESPPIATIQPENHMPESNKCTSSGFIGDSTDCKKFYRCVNKGDGTFTRYEFSCGEGTVWDTKIEACNHAWAVEKCGGASVSESTSKPVQPIHTEENTGGAPVMSDEYSTQSTITSSKSTTTTNYPSTTIFTDNNCKTSGFMGDSKDCKRFYRCVDDGRGGFVRYEFACGEGTVWDASIDACNHAWAVKGQCSQTGNNTSSNNLQSSTQSSLTENPTESEDQGYNQSSTQITSTSTSAGSKPSGNQCTQEGFYGDESNCKNFYRCVDNEQGGYIKYEFTCGEGTVWDQDIQACDHESPGKTCGGPSSGTTIKVPNHENDEMVAESTTKEPESSTENSENNYTQEKPQASDDKCESEGFYGDSNDCQKFYRCADNGKGGYTKYEFTCGDGTYWDQDILACDHASNGKKCTISSTAATTSTSGTNMSESSTNAQEQQTSRPSEVPSSGNDQCTMDGFFANSYDCNKFYRCVSNGHGGFTKYEFSCGEGTVWVQEIQACDYDNDISSCSTKNNYSKPETEEEHQSTSSISSSTSGLTTQSQIPDKEDDEYPGSSSSKPPAASEQCTSEGFHANEYNCTRFYRCVDNGQGGYTKYDFTCGEGTAWDSNIQTCNHINEVDSCKSANEETKPSNDDESTQSSQSTSTAKDTFSTESSFENKCNQEGFYGNTQDCTKFYRCVDNGKGGLTKYDFTCGEGTIWDQDLTTCNHPQDVNNPSCEKNEGNESSSGSSSSTESSGSTSATSTTSQSSQGTTESNNQGSSNCSQETSSKKPTNIKYKCKKAGFYPDPDDCKKFYRCVDWDGNGNKFSVYHFDCGEGTIWDPELETCNHEDSVYPPRNCSGTQSQNQNVSQETTTTETPTTSQDNSSTASTTTTQPSTEEPSTTQQSSSSEQTTQQTGTEKTTTQQSSTSEKTTTEQQSTSEPTTQRTSTEITNTQQITSSSEQTTSEQTTTEQTTTSQELTTQETATSQPTTSSEQTTSEQMTTSVQSTTQPSTTSQQSTQQSSYSESSTTEQFTTQESTTSEQTTQQSSNTDATTTESGHTEQQSSTSKEQTTATTEQTDQQSTTEQTVAVNTTEQETSTTEGSTTTTTGSSESTTTESDQGTTSQETSSEKECPETEEDQVLYVCPTSFRRHPKYCNMFYQCTEDNESHDVKIANFKCPNNTIYDESKTQCVEEEKADKKCTGQIARKQRVKRRNADYKEPIEVGRNVNQCPAVGYYPFEKDNECSGAFLKCQRTKSGRLRGYVHRCPDGYTYWSISKRCEKNNDMKDCKQSANIWSNRYEIPVEKKNIAK